MIDAAANDHRTLLGGLSPREFMAQHWQKKRRLMRGAVPQFAELIDIETLWKLAASDEVESRLVIRDGKQWALEQGPFTKKRRASLPDRGWTLLVQGLNLHVPAADALLRRFNFLPYARLDDVMISLAAPGGGVGPHFDSYDVFLLQGMGTRRWKLSEQTDLELDPEAPLKILKKLRADETVDLAAGDMLYLPPQVAHDGVAMQAEGFCTTYSIGFRAPTRQEIADGFLDWIGATSEIEGRLSDPDLTATQTPARVPKIYQREIFAAIEQLQMDRSAIRQFAGCFATDPKPQVNFDPPDAPLSRAAFAKAAQSESGGVAFAAATLCLYDDEFLFINGEAFVIKGDAAFWRMLADERRASITAKQASETLDALYAWYCDGWVQLNRP
jgi:50S ribosomal protein L16 3-hydroxylase